MNPHMKWAGVILLTLFAAACATPPPPPEPPPAAPVAQTESGDGAYSFTVNMVRADEVICSRDMATGSHKKWKYCRSAEDARIEREAAREFFQEAMRNSGH